MGTRTECEKLAAAINQYWAELGYSANAQVVKMPGYRPNGGGEEGGFTVISDTIRGLPVDFHMKKMGKSTELTKAEEKMLASRER